MVANHLKKLRRDFLWSSIDAPKMPLVEWVKVCMTLQNGGLGIQRLRQFNYALLDKCYGDMEQREMPFGGRLLRQNMGMEGVVGALNQ